MYLKKNKVSFIFIILILFLILLSSNKILSVYAQKEELTQPGSTIISAIYYLGKELGYSIDKQQLRENLSYFGASPLMSEKPSPDAIIKSARNQGIFLNGFWLGKENWRKLTQINSVFLIYLKGKGYVVVKNIIEEEGNYTFDCILPNGMRKKFNASKISSLWNGNIFSLPLINIIAKRLNSGSLKADNRFVAIYAYHSGEDFNKFSKMLDKLRKKAKYRDKKLIYLDELGLIPEETVKNRMKRLEISEKKAFKQIKQSIFKEDKMLEKGIPLNIGSEFYQKLYKWLAKYKVKSIVEDLDYDLWKEIVMFDNLKLHDKATKLFFTRNIEGYVDTMERYTKGFWKYNVKKRDEQYRNQIKEIMQNYPHALLFTLRGIGHYGMEEGLNIDNFSVDTLVFTKGKLRSNLISSQALHVLWANGVRVKERKQRKFFLKSFPQEALRAYFKGEHKSISKATRLSINLTKDLSRKEVVELSGVIRKATLTDKLEKKENVWQFVYNWIRENKME